MKIERPPLDLTLPVLIRSGVSPSPARVSPKTRTGYGAPTALSTVGIHRIEIQRLPIYGKSTNLGSADTLKGLYIDLWA